MVSLVVTLFSAKCFLFVYMNTYLLKLKTSKLFENSDADLYLRSQLVIVREGIVWLKGPLVCHRLTEDLVQN